MTSLTRIIDWLLNIDAGLFVVLNQGLQNSFLDFFMPALSTAGNGGLLWVAIGICLLLFFGREARRAGILMLVALLISYLTGDGLLKNFFHRPRPYEVLAGVKLMVLPLKSFSFPSGHAASAFACAVVLAQKFRRLALPAYALAVLMSFSRVYVGVHYPFDVLAGALLGYVCAALVLKVGGTTFRNVEKTRPPTF